MELCLPGLLALGAMDGGKNAAAAWRREDAASGWCWEPEMSHTGEPPVIHGKLPHPASPLIEPAKAREERRGIARRGFVLTV
jgi:hypothetical protein